METASKVADEYMTLLQTKEELCDELKPHVFKTPNFHSLNHPLIISAPYTEMMNAVYNRQFKFKKIRVEELKQKGNYHGYIFFHERPYRLNAFVDICDKLTDEQYWEALRIIWIDTENFWQLKTMWNQVLSDKNRLPSRHLFMSDDDKREFQRLTWQKETIAIMRGCRKHNTSGLSWTVDRKVAESFANRMTTKKNPPIVLSGTVAVKHIIAYTNDRSEKEIIVPSKYVKDIKTEVLK